MFRVRLGLGGGDISQAFHWLLQKCTFPYKNCDPNKNPLDAVLLQNLKHEACHVNLDVCGCTERQFVIRQPQRPVLSYTIQVSEILFKLTLEGRAILCFHFSMIKSTHSFVI